MGGCRSEENENSPDSCKNGQVQILVSGSPLETPPLPVPALVLHFPVSLPLFLSSLSRSLPSFWIFIDRF